MEAVFGNIRKMCERENFPQNMIVPDAACKQFGCQAKWGLGNQLFVYAGNHPPLKDESTGLPINILIHHIKWDTEMHKPIARKLVNESHDIFIKLQNLDPNEQATDHKINLLKISREYRSVIKACELELKANLGKCKDDITSEEMKSELGLLSVIELVWNLVEILFIETLQGGVLLQQLLGWLRMHFTEVDDDARSALMHNIPEQHPRYWQAVFMFVFQGRLEDARKMLSMHSDHRSQPYVLMDHLLKLMPSYNMFAGQSIGEFEHKWHQWQAECKQRLDQGSFATDLDLTTICKILCGVDEVFVEHRDLLGDWYCLLVSRLLYQQPSVEALDLHRAARFCLDVYGGLSNQQPWSRIVLTALEFDIHQMIRECSSSLSNWWFSAHLTDLLHHCGKFNTQSLQYGSNLREFLVMEYATSMMSHSSLWQIGVNYLDYCPQYGRSCLEHYLEKVPLESDKKAHKVIRLCEQREMHDQVCSICKVMGMRALHNRQLGAALSWGLRSKDVNFVTFLAEKFLNEYHSVGDFSHLDLLDNLGPSMLLSPKLTFLGKYREFHKLYEDGEVKPASDLLLSLLASNIAPKKFWLTLLTDALPMLEVKEVIFNKAQTYKLMHCLEEISVANKIKKKSANQEKQSEEEQDRIGLIRLGLARNLARAIVTEGTLT